MVFHDTEDADRASASDLFNKEEGGKESTAIYVNSDATVFDALTCMAKSNQTYVVVNKGTLPPQSRSTQVTCCLSSVLS